MLEFQLFRVQVYKGPQSNVFDDSGEPRDILTKLVLSSPTRQQRSGIIWHIANILPLNSDNIYFRIGKTTTTTIETFKNGNFVDEEFESAPYTHVLLNLENEVCGIANKPRLSPTTYGIASQLSKLMNESPVIAGTSIKIKVSDLKDPADFIESIGKAYRIEKFSFNFNKPNAWDINKDIYEPFQRALAAANGDKGTTVFKGESLDQTKLQDLTRTIASLGNDASALLEEEEGGRKITKKLRQNPVKVFIDDIADNVRKIELVKEIVKKYKLLRGYTNDEN